MQTEIVGKKAVTTPEAQRLQLINEVIAEVRPTLVRDGGDCQLISVDGNKINVRLTGACVFCKLASATLEGIQAEDDRKARRIRPRHSRAHGLQARPLT